MTIVAKAVAYMKEQLETMETSLEQDEKIYFDGSLKLPDLRGEQD